MFLTTAAGVVLGARLARRLRPGRQRPSPSRVIGTGGRARGLMNQLKRWPATRWSAICDVYEPRLLQAAEIAGPAALEE